MAFDIAVTSGLRRDLVNRSAEDGSAATLLYEDYKRSYLNTETICQEEGISFIPLVCEEDGGAGAQLRVEFGTSLPNITLS